MIVKQKRRADCSTRLLFPCWSSRPTHYNSAIVGLGLGTGHGLDGSPGDGQGVGDAVGFGVGETPAPDVCLVLLLAIIPEIIKSRVAKVRNVFFIIYFSLIRFRYFVRSMMADRVLFICKTLLRNNCSTC